MQGKVWGRGSGAIRGLGSVYCTPGGGGKQVGCLDCLVNSLKWSQHAHVSLNLIGLSFAWQTSFSISAVLSTRQNQSSTVGGCVPPEGRDTEVGGVNEVYSKGFFVGRGRQRGVMKHVMCRSERWGVGGNLGD